MMTAREYLETGYCYKCETNTETVLLPLSSGHIGRVCSRCRALRKGRPYASRREYEFQKNTDACKGQGANHVVPDSR